MRSEAFRDSGGMQCFRPGAETAHLYRRALGRFVTGVTVVTASSPVGPIGITVNSFTSVSLDPPLILWCPAKGSGRYRLFAEAARFSVHVLGEEQLSVSRHFAAGAGAFGGMPYELTKEGTPAITGSLARFDCLHHATHDGGDHAIVVGKVVFATVRDGAPLVFSGGDYGQFSSGI